jgi:hypothetical protein
MPVDVESLVSGLSDRARSRLARSAGGWPPVIAAAVGGAVVMARDRQGRTDPLAAPSLARDGPAAPDAAGIQAMAVRRMARRGSRAALTRRAGGSGSCAVT